MDRNLLIFTTILIISILDDKNFKKCKNFYGILFFIIHHLLNIYQWFGSFLFGYHLYHFLFLLISTLLFIYNAGCFLSKIHNRMCNLDDNLYFSNFINKIFGDKNAKNIHLIIIFILLIYDFYNFYK